MKGSVLIQTLLGFAAVFFLAGGLLWYQSTEDQRLKAAQQAVLERQLDDAMTLYAENCAVCHGIRGEGIGSTPALDREDLRNADPESLHKIISRGLYNTAMPAWNIEDGGPLSDYQITELVNLIRYGDWQAVQDRVVNLGLAPTVPFTSEPDPGLLDQVSSLPEGDLLARGIEVYAQQCVACHGPDGQGTDLAPALNTPEVRNQDPADIERTIRYGVNGTLMAGWDGVLSDDDITALVTLITRWDEVPSGTIPEPDKPIPVTEESLALGEQLYAQNCAVCHGTNGQGTRRAPALNVKSYLESTSDQALQQIITNGVPGTAMPAWGTRLTDAEIQAIVGYIRSWEPTAPEVAQSAAQGGGPWWATEGGTKMETTAPGGGPPWQSDTSSSRRGGPRWQRESTTAPSVAPTPTPVPALPTPTPMIAYTPGIPGATSTTPTPTVCPEGEGHTGTEGGMAAHTPGAEAGGAGHAQGTPMPGEEHAGGPPWLQPTPEPTPAPWWEDTNAVLLIGSVSVLGLLLTSLGFMGAKWFV